MCVCVSRSSPSSSFLPLLKEPFLSFFFFCLSSSSCYPQFPLLPLPFAHLFLSFPSVYFYIFLPPASLALFLCFTRSFSPRLFFPYCFFSWFYFFYLQPFPPSSSLFHFFSLGCFMLLYLLISYPSIAPLLILSSFLSSFCFSLGSFLNVSLSRLLS